MISKFKELLKKEISDNGRNVPIIAGLINATVMVIAVIMFVIVMQSCQTWDDIIEIHLIKEELAKQNLILEEHKENYKKHWHLYPARVPFYGKSKAVKK